MPLPTSYTLLDFGASQRLEQWGPYRLIRPDPTATSTPSNRNQWYSADATYQGEKGKGAWSHRRPLPDHWPVQFDDLQLYARLAPYKHTGIFPEQQQNWNWMRQRAKLANRPLTILNLFAYTGGASIALAKDGHHITHVDAAKPSIGWAKENASLNNIPADKIRWMLEDAPAFAARELRRGKNYDAILLDPPAFGHSPTGKTWRLDRDLPPLLQNCIKLLSPNASFIVLNAYAQNETPEKLKRELTPLLRAPAGEKVNIESRELLLKTPEGRSLSTGIVARCTFS